MVLVTTTAMVLLGALSRAPFHQPSSDQALLRLSWRLRGERTEVCRDRTPEELAKLPVHMRTPQVCSGHLATYDLRIRVDSSREIVRTIEPEGARSDRPLYVLHEIALSPGVHRVQIRFSRKGSGDSAAYEMDSLLTAKPGDIELVTIDHQLNRLVHRSGR
jgi:hypothetical protein